MLRKTLAALSVGASIYAGIHGYQAFKEFGFTSERLEISRVIEAHASTLSDMWSPTLNSNGPHALTPVERISLLTIQTELNAIETQTKNAGHNLSLYESSKSLELMLGDNNYSISKLDDLSEDVSADLQAESKKILTGVERASEENKKYHSQNALGGMLLALGTAGWCGYLCMPRKYLLEFEPTSHKY